MESTAESFNHTNEPSLNRLPTRMPEKPNHPAMQNKENNYSRYNQHVPTIQPAENFRVPSAMQNKENNYNHYFPVARPIENFRIPPRRHSSNDFHDVQQPLQTFNHPMNRQFDYEVFYPPSISSARISTPRPDFSKPDGRSSREIKHDLEKIYNRVQENERRSQMGFYPIARPISRRALSTVQTSYLPNYPIAANVNTYRSSSTAPNRVSISNPPVKPTTYRSSSTGPDTNRIPTSHPSRPSSRSSVASSVNRISRASNTSNQDNIDRSKKGLIEDIDLNYPNLLTLLKPVVLKTSNELPKNILNALRKRHEILVSGLKRIQISRMLATEERRKRLNSEIQEKKDEQLACLSLIEQIISRFFPNGTDKPGSVGAVADQIRFLRKIFSLNWDLAH